MVRNSEVVTQLRERYNDLLKNKYNNKYVIVCPNCGFNMSVYVNLKHTKEWYCYKCKSSFDKPKRRLRQSNRCNLVKKRTASDTEIGEWNKARILKQLELYWRDPLLLKEKDVRNQAFIIILWLTASRITEISGRPHKGVTRTEAYKTDEWEIEPLRKKQIYFQVIDGTSFLVIDRIPILKRKKSKRRNMEGKDVYDYPIRQVLIPVEPENDILYYFKRYWDTLPETESADEMILFPFGTMYANTIIRKFCGWYNHFIRHCREQDLVIRYGFSALQLQAFTGWATAQMAEKYTHVTGLDVGKAMVNKYNERKAMLENI